MKHVTVVRSDDFGSAGQANSVRFSFEGQDYEIDLNKRNFETFLRRMEPYVKAGRRASGPTDVQIIRQWAVENGLTVSDRGFLPKSVIKAYEDAHADND